MVAPGSSRRARSLAFGLVTAASLYSASPALANGRFPRAQVIEPVPGGDGRTVYVRATFGLLVTHDAGDTWSWVCEAAMGYDGEWDPPLTATRDGRAWLGMASGLHVLDPSGCGFTDVPDLAGEYVTDLTNGADDAWPLVAISSQPGDNDHPARPGRIARTRDGVHFSKLGAGLQNVHFDTVEIAASRPSRLYASGYLPGDHSPTHLWRSDDGGVTLTAIDPVVPRQGRLYIGAVDPKNPDRLLVRLLDEKGSDVIVSKDGGKTFKSVVHFASSNYGFACTRDGVSCYVSSANAAEGVFVSHDRGESWTHGAAIGTFGMHTDDRGAVWALSNPYHPGGFFAGRSDDGGQSFVARGTFAVVQGPVACDAGAALQCPTAWDATRALLVDGRPPVPADAGGPVTAVAADVDAGEPSAPAPPPPRRACSCTIVGSSSGSSADSHLAIVGVLGLAGVSVIRRRRRVGSGRGGSLAPQA